MAKQAFTHQVLYIKGMTCINCEAAINRVLHELKGVKKDSIQVSYKTSKLEFNYQKGQIKLPQIIKAIEDAGYLASEEPFNDPLVSTLIKTGTTLFAILVAYFALDYFGLLNFLVPSQLASSGSGLGALFIIGLITSVHCIAMCGGINLSVSIPRNQSEQTPQTPLGSLRAPLSYNLGRVVSYTVIGFALGALGSLAGMSFDPNAQLFAQGVIKIVAGVFMVIMGLSMLNLFPGIRRFVPRIPQPIRAKISSGSKLKNRGPFVVGLLNGFMPCGPLQSIQIIAFASGNPLLGAASMFMFSVGTVPLMLGFGSLISTLGARFAKAVTLFGAGLVVVLGLAMLSQGGALSGLYNSTTLLVISITLAVVGLMISLPYADRISRMAGIFGAVTLAVFAGVGLYLHGPVSTTKVKVDADVAVMQEGIQVVKSELLPGQYPTISVTEGVPVRWVINAAPGTINGCNNRFIIRDYGIEYRFIEGENIIEFTPNAAGTVEYSCWMGMIPGQILVGK